jgi:tetratricopeptide (TPR) repeat protein
MVNDQQQTSTIPPWLRRLGSRIRLARRASGLTQTDAAGPGLTKSFVSLLESGRTYPSVGTLVTIADRLQTSLGQLLLDDDHLKRETALNLIALARSSPHDEQIGLLLDAAEGLAGDSDDLAVELRLVRGDIAAARDRSADADRWYRDALAQAKRRRLRAYEPRALGRLATLAHQNGDLTHARTNAEDALAAFRASRTLRTLDGCNALILYGSILVNEGKPARALRVFEDAVRTAEREGLEAALGRAYAGIGRAHAAARHVNRAIDALQRARDTLQTVEENADLGSVLYQLGRLQLEGGHLDAAQESLERGTQVLQHGDAGLRADALTDLARTHLRAGRIVQAQNTARSALALAGQTHDPGRRGRALVMLGLTARSQHRTKPAVEYLKEAVLLLRKARLQSDLAEATRELDRLMKEKSPAAEGAESQLAGTGGRARNGPGSR